MSEVELHYTDTHRPWLLNDGFDALHLFLQKLCGLAVLVSIFNDPVEDGLIRMYFCEEPDRPFFSAYDTDTYPEDGWSGFLFQPHDFIYGPFPTSGYGKRPERTRWFTVMYARVEHNPEHGLSNVSQLSAPRLRPSILVEEFGFDAEQLVEPDGTLGIRFEYSNLRLQGAITHNLYRELGLEIVQEHHVKRLPAYQNFLNAKRGNGVSFERYYSQEYDPDTRRWRGVANGFEKDGWFSQRKVKVWLE